MLEGQQFEEEVESTSTLGSVSDSPPVTDEGRCGATFATTCPRTEGPQPKPTATSGNRNKTVWTKIKSHHIVGGICTTPYRAGVIQQREWTATDPLLNRKQVEPCLSLCPLGGIARRPAQLTPVMSKEITWEKLTLTVDSGASDTVVPPKFCAWSSIFHTEKVGTEYEVANGQVVQNLGERRCTIKVGDRVGELNIAFQVVEVHKPLLAVSSLTAQGHRVIFADQDDHILLSNNEKLPLRNVNGVFELDVWVKHDPSASDFTRQGLQR